MSRPDLYQYDPEPFIVRRSLALMLRVVRVGHCVGEAEAELCTRLSTQQVPGPGCTAHWTQCIDHTNTQPPPRERERELSPLPGCSSLLSPVAEMWRWRRHLVRARPPTSDTPQPQPHYLFHSGSQQPHDISWAEH